MAGLDPVLAAVLESTSDAVMVTDRAGTIQRVNHAFTKLTGFGAAKLEGLEARELFRECNDDSFCDALWTDTGERVHLYSVQHLTWNTATGAVANVSGCDNAVTALLSDAPGLTAESIMSLSSALRIFNTGTSPVAATFDIFRAADGSPAGAWTSPMVAARGFLRTPFATVVSAAGVSAALPNEQFVARLRSGFSGYAQHVGMIGSIDAANLSTACAIKTQ